MRTVEARIPVYDAWPPLYEALITVTRAAYRSGLEISLVDLVMVRGSQVAGCGYCVNLHTQQAIDHGETPARMDSLEAWRGASCFSERERAALELTEVAVSLPARAVIDAAVDVAVAHFGAEGLAKLLLVVAAINAWNRVNIVTDVGD